MSSGLFALPADRLTSALQECGLPESLVTAVMNRAPFADEDALARAVDRAVLSMSVQQLVPVLHAERASDTARGDADALEAARLALRLYESRFGYPYVSSIATPTAEELLMRVRIRLGNEPEPEGRAAREHFRRIVRARLEELSSAVS